MMFERPLRTIKSFARRQGRLTSGQKIAIEKVFPTIGIEILENTTLHFDALFGRNNSKYFEIGFGNGDSFLEVAKENPLNDYIGIEVYKPGVGHCCQQLIEQPLSNVRLIHHDAMDVLQKHLPENSLDGVQLFFPDPWPKKRHHKRRFVQPDTLSAIAKVLKPGGIFHVATDVEAYAEHTLSELTRCDDFKNLSPLGDYVPRPKNRPLTKFEKRGLNLGHGVWDIQFKCLKP